MRASRTQVQHSRIRLVSGFELSKKTIAAIAGTALAWTSPAAWTQQPVVSAPVQLSPIAISDNEQSTLRLTPLTPADAPPQFRSPRNSSSISDAPEFRITRRWMIEKHSPPSPNSDPQPAQLKPKLADPPSIGLIKPPTGSSDGWRPRSAAKKSTQSAKPAPPTSLSPNQRSAAKPLGTVTRNTNPQGPSPLAPAAPARQKSNVSGPSTGMHPAHRNQNFSTANPIPLSDPTDQLQSPVQSSAEPVVVKSEPKPEPAVLGNPKPIVKEESRSLQIEAPGNVMSEPPSLPDFDDEGSNPTTATVEESETDGSVYVTDQTDATSETTAESGSQVAEIEVQQTVEPESTEPSELEDVDDEPIRMRELSINGDGTFVDSEQQAQEEFDNEPPEDEATDDLDDGYAETNGPRMDVSDQDSGSSLGPAELSKEIASVEPLSRAPVVETPAIVRDYTGFPKQSITPNRSVLSMKSTIERCLRYYYSDVEIANRRSNWGMMHAIMVYGVDTKIIANRRSYSAIAWIAGNNACRGQRLLTQRSGQIQVRSGVGLQGHQAQMLAVFSLCDVPASYPLYVGKTKFAVQDVIEAEKLACKSGEELTFTLIGLSHYLDTEDSWVSSDGQTWDFERLIREELSQPIVGAACGGTHRLMGFAHALRKRRAAGLPIEGQWLRAEKFLEDFERYAYGLQNRDGSMSTNWFKGRQDNGDVDRKVQTTGHIVEWLLTITPDDQLQNPRLVSAVRFLMNAMYRDRKNDWSIGPKGHALRSLAIYHERVFQQAPPWRRSAVATSSSKSRR